MTKEKSILDRLSRRVRAGQPLRVGVVGLGASPGSWAETAHLPALRAVEGIELRGVSASSLESARTAAQRHGVPHAFASAAEMARSDDIDVIVISVRVPLHAEAIRAVLGQGKLIFSEWPLGVDTEEARSLAREAADAGTPTKVGLQARFNPPVAYVRDLVTRGYVGDVLSSTVIGSGGYWGAETVAGDEYLIAEEAGATMRTIAVGHAVDALSSVFSEPRRLRVEQAVRRHEVLDGAEGKMVPQSAADQVWFSGRSPQGAVITGHYRGGTQRGTNLLWEILGTEGELRITHEGTGHFQVQPMKVEGAPGTAEVLRELPLPAEYVKVDGVNRYEQPQAFIMAHQYAALLGDLRDGTDLVASWDDAVARHESIDVATEA